MAQSTSRLLSLDEVRASVRRVQAEGEKLVDRLRTDARALVERGASRPEVRRIREDLQQRADTVLREVDTRRLQIQGRVETLLRRLAELLVSALKVVRQEQLEELSRRLARIERRLEDLAKDKAADKAA